MPVAAQLTFTVTVKLPDAPAASGRGTLQSTAPVMPTPGSVHMRPGALIDWYVVCGGVLNVTSTPATGVAPPFS